MWDQKWPMAILRERIRTRVVEAATKRAWAYGQHLLPPVVVVDIQLPLYSLQIQTLPQAVPAMYQLQFSPKLVAIADNILFAIAKRYGGASFNGLHLRLEKDQSQAHKSLGGINMFIESTLEHCKQAGLSTLKPLYVASGLLTYPNDLWANVKYKLITQYASRVLHKEMFLGTSELAQLDSEQLAVVDFLVLARSKKYVGFAISTFSLLLREYRYVHGFGARNDSVLMEKTKYRDMGQIRKEWCRAACLQ